MATYRRQTTGPDLTVPRRPLHECPIRVSASQQPWQPRGLSLWYKTWRTYTGTGSPPDETEPDWDDTAAVTAGLYQGGNISVQNGQSVKINIAFAGYIGSGYQLVWTKRTENTTSPASPSDELITTDFLTEGPHEIELTSTTGKRTLMRVGGNLSQVNFFMA